MEQTQQPNILIVDDQPAELKALRDYLRARGLRTPVATGGEHALKRVHQQSPPDIILLDVFMPYMDGFETCRRLKADKNTEDIPVIFMTALDDVVDKVRGFELGGVDYIAKPCHPEEVWARVNTHLKIRQLLQQFETLANATFEGIVIHEGDGRMIYVNQRIEEMFGYECAENVPDQNILGLIAQESHHDVIKRLRMKDDDPYQVEGVQKDGTSFPIEIQARPILYGG